MKNILYLALVALFATLIPRSAAACDYSCATLERVGGTVVIGVPTTTLTLLIAPAVISGLSEPASHEVLPSYGTGVTHAVIGSSAGMILAYVVHRELWPNSEYGGAGTGMSASEFVAYWTLPPLLLGTGAALYAYKYKRREKPGGPPGMSSYFVTPTDSGFVAGMGGRF